MRAIARAASDAIVTVDRSGTIVDANPALLAMFGHAEETIIGRPVAVLLAASERGPHRDVHERLMTSGDPESVGRLAQLRGVRADGQEFAIEVSRTVWSAGDETFATAVIRDLSARWRAEEAAAQWATLVGSSPSAIVRLTVDGRIESWNIGAEALCGLAAREAIGQPITILDPPGDSLFAEPVRSAGAGHTVRLETVIALPAGREADVEVSVSPILSRGREIIGVLWVAQDIGDRKRAHRELARLADAARHGADAVISVDLEGRVRHWSEGAAKLYGFSADEAIGRDFAGLTALADEPGVNSAEVLARAPSHQHEVRRRRKDGTIIEVLATVIPWRVDGTIVGRTGIAIDITERKLAERVRERALADVHEAQHVARMGSWSWNPATGEMSWSPQMFEIYARDARRGPVGMQEMMGCVHPDDRELVASSRARAIEHGVTLDIDHRIIAGDGVTRTVHVLGRLDPDHPGCYLGTLQDVTAERQAQAELRRSEQRLRAIFDGAPIGVALARAGAPFELLQANTSLAAMLGVTPAALAGRETLELIDPSQREIARTHLQRLVDGDACSSAIELNIRGRGSEPLWVSVHGAVIAGGDGPAGHLVLQLQDITERKALELELRGWAERDPLTGLLNRRGMSQALARALADNQRYGTPATLLACDLDNLKPVNDTFGHQAGDELLAAVARTLSEQVRDTDVVARMGGDEFVVLLAHTGVEQAGAMARRLRASVSAIAMPPGAAQTSLSIGIAPLGDGLDTDEALIAADLAMYEAKRRGPSRTAVSRHAPAVGTPSTHGDGR
ncbi:MAG: PAS domain S-box protein [Solirubrobacteraceae bacterium]|jgi:diguanylate cyclase (GGDEF)-like protein/PAS domain S-box-containing protein